MGSNDKTYKAWWPKHKGNNNTGNGIESLMARKAIFRTRFHMVEAI